MTDKTNLKGQRVDLTRLKNLGLVKDFLEVLQCGDIQLSKTIPYGISLYGQTKVGKTSACHGLASSPLKGQKIGGQIMFVTNSNNFKTALIGNEGNSQTQIPNFFQLKLQQKGFPIVLIDTPGYGDSYGVYRILSNGFYHYRLYSKVQNMKFLITFDRDHLKNTAQKVIETIQQFTSSFRYYKDKQKRDQIWNSAAFLITKVENGQNQLLDIKVKFLSLSKTLKTQLLPEDDQLFRQFMRYMVQKDKIFIIQHAVQNQPANFTGLLQKINLKLSTWWTRQVKEGVVDMKPINYCIGKNLSNAIFGANAQFAKQQFSDLIVYMNYRVQHYLKHAKGSMKNFFKEIGQDAIESPNSHQFLNLMKNFVDENYKFRKDYQKKRTQLQKSLFDYISDNPQNSANGPVKAVNDKQKQAYLIKKFRVIQFLQKIKSQINKMQKQQTPQSQKMQQNKQDGQRIGNLKFIQQRIYELIRLLNTVKFMKDDSKQIIYKYGYLIHRMIEQSKIFIMLIEGVENDSLKQALFSMDVSKDPHFKPILIIIQLKDLMGQYSVNGQSLGKLKEKYVLDFDFKNKDILLTESLIDFLTSMTVTDNKIAKNIIQLVSRYCSELLQKRKKSSASITMGEKKRMIKRLYLCRQQCDFLVIQSKGESDIKQTQGLIMILRNLTIQLGYFLEQMKNYSAARAVYESIYFVDKVLSIYSQMVQKQPQNVDLRIQYATYASQHCRQTVAIQVLQKGFQLVTRYEDLQQVKKTMINIQLKSKSQDLSEDYTKALHNNNYYKPFNYAIQNTIKKITEEDAQNQTPK